MPLNTLAGGSALVDVCKTYVERLSAPDGISVREAWLLSDNLCNLIALLTAPEELSVTHVAMSAGRSRSTS